MILCAGEALIDMLPRLTEAGEDAFAPYPGGAVFNTAIALARLGEATAFFTGLSDDLFGQRLQSALDNSGVDTSLAHRSDKPTTLAFVTLADGQARYAFYDENTAGRLLNETDLPPIPAKISALFVGGISLAAEPCGAAYATLAQRAAKDRVVMIDPNIRPAFIADEAAYRARIEGLIARADIVKLSDEDLQWLYGTGSAEDQAARVLESGARILCLTEGARGVTAFSARGDVFHAATPVNVVDTVGAGDTFNAGFLAGLVRSGLLSKRALADIDAPALMPALALGTRAAAVTVGRAGANPPWQEELS